MRVKLTVIAAAALILAFAGWTRAKASRALSNTEAALFSITAERLALEAEIQRTEERLAAAERRRAELAGSLKNLHQAKSSARETTPKRKSPTPRIVTWEDSPDPSIQVLMLRSRRASVMSEYGSFFRARGLTPEQIRRFEDNYVQHKEQESDLRAVARQQDEKGKATVAALQQRSQDEYAAAQAEVLGAENYRQLQEYLRTFPLRNMIVNGLAATAALEGVPLSAHQGEELLRTALHVSSDAAKASREEILQSIDWQALDGQARQILSPAQFEIFSHVAPPTGLASRKFYELEATVRRAQEKDAATEARLQSAR